LAYAGRKQGARQLSAKPKPTWEKSSAELVTLFGKLAPKDSAVAQKQMFEWPCFEPMPGRKMKGYVILTVPLKQDFRDLEMWITRSLEFTRTLPEKAKGPAKKRKKLSREL
jgi:hypothetical protein